MMCYLVVLLRLLKLMLNSVFVKSWVYNIHYYLNSTNMKKQNFTGDVRSTKHTDIQQSPRRVASRMEGVVKNNGTRNNKKSPKG